MTGEKALLQVEDLVAGYAGSRVLNGVSLRVRAGEAVTLLGRNGVGKTTFIETVMGMVRPPLDTCTSTGAT